MELIFNIDIRIFCQMEEIGLVLGAPSVISCLKNPINYSCIYICPGGLFIEPAFSTFAVFVTDFIPQTTVVLHLSQSSISLKSTCVLFPGYVKHLSGTIFFLR